MMVGLNVGAMLADHGTTAVNLSESGFHRFVLGGNNDGGAYGALGEQP
jgi:hypothetical protein